MTAPIIHTERLTLRGWTDQDRDPYAALNADPVVMEHFTAPLTRAQSDAHIDHMQAKFDRGEPSLWAVEVTDGTDASGFIGFTGLMAPRWEASFTPCVEVGWRLAAHAWGHGYASEAARAALRHGFEQHDLAEIVSFTAVVNERSMRVMERIGMTRDPADDFDNPSCLDDDRLRRHVLYRLSVDTWRRASGDETQ